MSLIRMKWEDADGRDFGDPPEFRRWLNRLTQTAFHAYNKRGYFDEGQAMSLWGFAGRKDPLPNKLRFMLRRDDVEALWPKKEYP